MDHDDYFEPDPHCDEYSHFLGFSNDDERDEWLSLVGEKDSLEQYQ